MPKGGIFKTHEQFIAELEVKNPNVFKDFEILNVYTGVFDKLVLLGKYGLVSVTPASLLQGSYPTIQSAKDKNEYFKNQAYGVHGDIYDYSKVDYTTAKNKVKIGCNAHGYFLQTPIQHLRGNGCPKCKSELHGKRLREDIIYFIQKSIEKHGYKYDYSLVDYETNNSFVDIICPIHGVFSQKSGNHMRGQGCPMCANVHYDIYSAVKHKNDYLRNFGKVYIIKIYSDTESFYKIGVTTKSIQERFKLLKKYGYKYEVLDYIEDNMYNTVVLEDYLHNTLSKHSYLPDGRFGGYTECYSYVDDVIIEFCYSNLPNRISKIEMEVLNAI